MALVLGVGAGVFALALLWTITLLVCVVFSRSQLRYVGLSAFVLTSIITVVLLLLPRELKTTAREDITKVYEYSIIYRYLLLSGCILFLLIGLGAFLSFHVMEPVYAKTLRRIR